MTAETPTIRQLRAFEAAARLESVTRAAVTLNLSQPAVTQAIAKLEQILDVLLLERTRTGSYLTEYGSLVLNRTQRMFAQIEGTLCDPLIGKPFAAAEDIRSVSMKITDVHVRSLLAISEATSFAQAAGKLGLSEPSLQRSARELERIVGAPLYHRSAHGFTVTRSGRELAKRFRLAIREIEYASEELAAAKGRVTTRIRIGAIPLNGMRAMAHAINDILTTYPDAQIQLVENRYDPLLEDLRSGAVDILFGVLRKPAWATDVVEEAFYVDPYCVVVRSGHPLAGTARVGLSDLAAYEWILPGDTNPRRKAFEQLFQQSPWRPRIAIETSSIAAHKTILEISDRITLLTRGEIESSISSVALTTLNVEGLAPRKPEGIATRRDWEPTIIQKTFIALLRRHASSAMKPADQAPASPEPDPAPARALKEAMQ